MTFEISVNSQSAVRMRRHDEDIAGRQGFAWYLPVRYLCILFVKFQIPTLFTQFLYRTSRYLPTKIRGWGKNWNNVIYISLPAHRIHSSLVEPPSLAVSHCFALNGTKFKCAVNLYIERKVAIISVEVSTVSYIYRVYVGRQKER